MGINVANARTVQMEAFDEKQRLLVRCADRRRQKSKIGQHGAAPTKISHRQFANHKGMAQNLPGLEQVR